MSGNNVFVYSTTLGSIEETEDNQNIPVLRKKSISMNDNEIKNRMKIRLVHRKSNSCSNIRKDGYGNIISKNNKNYKVSFRDGISCKPLTEVIPFKKILYTNETTNAHVGKVEMAKCECKCLIF
jgi:hypothetical protein